MTKRKIIIYSLTSDLRGQSEFCSLSIHPRRASNTVLTLFRSAVGGCYSFRNNIPISERSLRGAPSC